MKHSDILKEANEFFLEMSRLGDDVTDISAVKRTDHRMSDIDGTLSTAVDDEYDTTIHGQAIAPESAGDYLIFDKFMDDITAREDAKVRELHNEAKENVRNAARVINKLYREKWVNRIHYGGK